MVGYSTSCCESGIVSRPSAGASLGAGSELSDVRPIGTRHKETSRRVSRSSSRFTSGSTNPSTILAASPEAADTASIFANRVPLSQPKWRQVRAWYFQAFRQEDRVQIVLAGRWTRVG